MARYNYYQAGNKVICVTHYAGKSVKAVAKCNPSDTFDFEFGKKLAKARADFKVAEKKCKTRSRNLDMIENTIRALKVKRCNLNTDLALACDELQVARKILFEIEVEF